MIKKVDRLGEIRSNIFGSKMCIIKYINANDILVRFESGYENSTKYCHFIKGNVYNAYDKSECGVGYIGEGTYTIYLNKEHTMYYKKWRSMLHRVYDFNFLKKNLNYRDCTVCEEWHNFQNFAKWYDENYYEILGEEMHLDKDILVKGNKVYSPETCIFVPQRINNLFIKQNKLRGKLPIGICLLRGKKYIASLSYNNKQLHIGVYPTIEEAFIAYKNVKEKYIKEVAEEYKEKIPQKLYEALYNYKVEITD